MSGTGRQRWRFGAQAIGDAGDFALGRGLECNCMCRGVWLGLGWFHIRIGWSHEVQGANGEWIR